jgi:hypothetical protein
MLVGDLILNVRSLGPDLPQVFPAPALNSLVPTTVGTLGAGTYFIVITAITPWGESLPSTEASVTLAGPNNAIQVNFFDIAGVTGIYRIYVGFTTGTESFFFQFGPGATSPITILNANNQQFGSPPVRSSAFLPDTDGGFVSAATMYRWLNDTLRAAARVTGGIQDACGIASTSGNRRYVAPGQWLKFDQCFYDGWELDLGNKAETFRNRNLTANIAISLMVDAQSDTTRIELYWTPSRTSGTATTTGPITAQASTIPFTGLLGWLLADGYAMISDGTNTEIVTYSAQNPTSLTGVIRGWAGTQPFAFQAGAIIAELNVELNGYRMPYFYSVGQAGVTLGVPPGWEPFLKDYLLGTFRKAEQETDEGEKLQGQATKALTDWVMSNKPVAGPRQMRMYGDYGLRGTVPGGLTGPIIIP